MKNILILLFILSTSSNLCAKIMLCPNEGVDTLIPNYISPNSDNLNDKFVLPDSLLIKYPNLKLVIYNRMGNIVWRSSGKYNNDWNGQLEGGSRFVPDGVYYYFLELEAKYGITKVGYIELWRK